MSSESIELESKLIERIVDKRKSIIAEGEERARRMILTAEEECERIRAESDKQVLSIVGSELKAVRDQITGEAKLAGRQMLMQARDELLSSVFEESETRLWKMAGEGDESIDFGDVLLNLVIEAVSAIGGDNFIIAANERDLKYLKKQLDELKKRVNQVLGEVDVKLDEHPMAMMGGVVVRNADGTKVFNNTLEGRLKTVRRRLDAEVAKTLGVI